MKKITFVLVFFSFFGYCQKSNGYWDVDNFTKRITDVGTISSGETTRFYPIVLPTGTTKLYFKISVSSKFKSAVLNLSEYVKNNPDPKIVASGAVINSTVGMSDPKCSFRIYDNDNNLIFKSSSPITGEYIGFLDNSGFKNFDVNNANNILKFCFTSENKMFNMKVSFEWIPFIDFELEKGWVKERKDLFFNSLFTEFRKRYTIQEASDGYIKEKISCLLDGLTKKYSFNQYFSMAEYEKTQVLKEIASICDSQ